MCSHQHICVEVPNVRCVRRGQGGENTWRDSRNSVLLLVPVGQWVALSVSVSWSLHRNEQALRSWCLELRWAEVAATTGGVGAGVGQGAGVDAGVT